MERRMPLKIIFGALLIFCSASVAGAAGHGLIWRAEGHGSTLFVIGEHHYAASMDPPWVRETAKLLDAQADLIILEGDDLGDVFPFLQADCSDRTVWSGQLRRQVEILEKELDRLNSLRFRPSPFIESISVGPLIWAIPSAMAKKGGEGIPSRSSRLVDSRILEARVADRSLRNWQSMVSLDSRYDMTREVCRIERSTRERFFVDIYASELSKSRLVQSYEQDPETTLSRMRIEGHRSASEIARLTLSGTPIPQSSLVTAFELATESPEIYRHTFGHTTFLAQITARNKSWSNLIDARMRTGAGVAVAFIGAAHIPDYFKGNKIYPGILSLLAGQGYTVSAVKDSMEVASLFLYNSNSINALHLAGRVK